MITASKYIDELNEKMSKTEKHITRCELALAGKHDRLYLEAVERNLVKSKSLKDKLHDEISGMVDFVGYYSNERLIDNFGWERYLPEFRKSGSDSYCYDSRDSHESLAHTGATQEDFEFW
jgi:hypothetical protein